MYPSASHSDTLHLLVQVAVLLLAARLLGELEHSGEVRLEEGGPGEVILDVIQTALLTPSSWAFTCVWPTSSCALC